MPAKHTQSKKNQPSNRPSMLFPLLLLGIGFGLGVIATQRLFAQSDSSQSIKACVKDNGTLRIVNTDTCEKNETLLVWNTQGPAGQPGATGATGPGGGTGSTGATGQIPTDIPSSGGGVPFLYCVNCQADGSFIGNVLAGQNLRKAVWYSGYFANMSLDGTDFSYAVLANSDFESLSVKNTNFEQADLRNSRFKNNVFTGTNFRGAKMDGVDFSSNNSWTNVTCPDGTNSDSNGKTCNGHL